MQDMAVTHRSSSAVPACRMISGPAWNHRALRQIHKRRERFFTLALSGAKKAQSPESLENRVLRALCFHARACACRDYISETVICLFVHRGHANQGPDRKTFGSSFQLPSLPCAAYIHVQGQESPDFTETSCPQGRRIIEWIPT